MKIDMPQFYPVCSSGKRGRSAPIVDAESEETSHMPRITLGQRIKWARELVEPNRAEFCRTIGVDVSTVRKVESDERGPGLGLLIRICHALRVSTDYAVYGSFNGVDPQLAAMLAARHPELVPQDSQNRDVARRTSRQPTRLTAPE